MALAAAGEEDVAGVVALAPWLAGSERTGQLRHGPTLIVHGSNDRVTSCRASQHYAARARADGAAVSFVEVERGEHTMLRRMPAFDLLAAHYTRAIFEPEQVSAGTRSQLQQLAVAARETPDDYRI